jgi:hypothetical protein
VLAGGAVAIVVLARLPLAAELLDRAGSVTPLTRLDRIYPAAVGVAALALGVGWLLERAWLRGRERGIPATAAALIGVSAATWWVDAARDTRRIVVTPFVEARWVGGLDPTGLPRLAIIASTIAIVAVAGWVRLRRRVRELDRGDTDASTPLARRLAACIVVAVTVGLAPATIDRARATWEPQAFDRSARDDRDFTRIEVYPARVRRVLASLDPSSTILASFAETRKVAALAPVQSVEESRLREEPLDPTGGGSGGAALMEGVDYVIAAADDDQFRLVFRYVEDCGWADRSAGTLRIYERIADGCRRPAQVDEP